MLAYAKTIVRQLFLTESLFVYQRGERKPVNGLNDKFSKEIYSLNLMGCH